jgi:hypothetical protein
VVFKGSAKNTGTDTAPSWIFKLPAGYRPSKDRYMVTCNQPAGDSTGALCMTLRVLSASDATNPGLVEVDNFAGTINPGPISFENIAFYL